MQMLTEKEKYEILQEFPKIKLSYETIVHKKVYDYNISFAIPEGTKCYAWFTSHKNNDVCFIIEIDNKNKKRITNIKIVKSCFSKSLCYGTIFYGTLFYHMNSPFFSIEDIFMYKSNNVSNLNINDKINKICFILKNDIKQVAYNNYFVVFGLPIISTSNDNFEHLIKNVKYKLNSIHYYTTNKSNSHFCLSYDEYKMFVEDKKISNVNVTQTSNVNQFNRIFVCKPDIQNDIYHLYTQDNEYVGLAAIPDYKTSVMMNNIFRIIKENNDLDALEESDDEEEFENSNIDKFVYLDKTYKIVCKYNKKFKKWVPIKITQ